MAAGHEQARARGRADGRASEPLQHRAGEGAPSGGGLEQGERGGGGGGGGSGRHAGGAGEGGTTREEGWRTRPIGKDADRFFWDGEWESEAMNLAHLLEASFPVFSLFSSIHGDLDNLLEVL